ncbi:hypothetical protein LP416_22870 [Polaromonas sp. P2-4]|nr:hypothetical protein LP416_22870 [Polaromonas sp. P2-4]
MLSALLAPVSMLAEEVRTGKLGGLCSASKTSSATNLDVGDGSAAQAGLHCDWCASLGMALPPLPVSAIPCFAGHQVVALDYPANIVATVTGLPFSRGPPAL